MRLKTVIILLTAIFVLSCIVTALIFFSLTILEMKITDMVLRVEKENVLGFSADNQTLDFGTLSLNYPGEVSRYIILKNDYKFPIEVKVYILGNIKKYIEVINSNLILKEKEMNHIEFKARNPDKMPWIGKEYKGKAIFIFERSR